MRFLRSVLALVLLVSAGCAGPQRAVLPSVGDDQDPMQAGVRELRTGDFVRIQTRSHEVVLGEVKKVTAEHVVLGFAGNFGYAETSVPADDVLTVELNGGVSAGSAARSVGLILGVTAAAIALAFVFFGSMGGN